MTKQALMKIITEVVRKEVQKEVKKIFITEQKKSKVTSKPLIMGLELLRNSSLSLSII